ncbi:MAG: MFS transporter [Dehalococcoidia bacterium]
MAEQALPRPATDAAATVAVPDPTAPGGAAAPGPAVDEAKTPPALALLRDPSFRNYWIANFFYFLVFGAQRFAFVLFILELTERAGLGGVVGFALGIPAFFVTVPAGVWADRLDRRTMVMTATLAGGAVVTVVAALIWTDMVNAWLLLLAALATGFATATVQPPMAAIVQMIVPPERLMNGIVLRTMGQNLAQFFGAGLTGVSVILLGWGGAFTIQAVLYFLVALLIMRVRLARPAAAVARPRMRDAATEGVRFVFDNPALRGLVIISVFSGLFMLGPVFTLVPEIARTNLQVGAGLNSLLMGVTSIGMLAMSIFLITRKELNGKGNLFVKNMLVAGPIVIMIGLSPWYLMTAFFMVAWGLGGGIYINMNQTLIQANTPNEMMGRVMSIYTLSIAGLIPLGALLGGLGAELIGADRYLAMSGALLTASAVWAFLTQKDLRALN